MKRLTTISRSVEIGLRFVGMWPDSTYATLYWFSYMTSIAIIQYYQYAYVIAHFELSDLILLMECLSLTLAYTLAFFKLFILWWNRRTFHCILRLMERDWEEYDNDDSYLSIMMSMADLARRFANVVFIINALSAFLLSIGEYALQTIGDRGNSTRELPIKMEFPFEVSKSPIFECFLFGQFVCDVVIACVVGAQNALLVTLILHVSGQIDIMRQDLIKISNCKYDASAFSGVIKGLIYKHQKIIALSENIENMFSSFALIQILWNTLVICCTGFAVIIIIGNDKGITAAFKSAGFYFAITLEAFIFCFAGEFLSAKSKSIADALYETLWYNMSPSDSRMFLFMILRAQKRLSITAGRVIDLTLESFTSIMKASVSYISVLNAMS